MAFHIRDKQTDKAVRELAAKRGVSLTQAVRDAAERELASMVKPSKGSDRASLRERIKLIQDDVAQYPRTGLKADKAFYDWLSGDE
jgi:antitoxin VapB